MGTSHRHKATVAGVPNWGKSSRAVTNLAVAAAKLAELRVNPPGNRTEKQISILRDRKERQLIRNYHKAIGRLVNAAGGIDRVSSGSSRAIGHAGISAIEKFVFAVQEIITNGLAQWLQRRGESLEGKRCRDVIEIIRQYVEAEVVGLDNTAANEAMECVLDQLEEQIDEDTDEVADEMSTILSSADIKGLVDLFFGMYIYSHLAQDFEEKLEYEKGSLEMKKAMDEIRDQIIDDIKTARSGRDVQTVDWSKPEGNTFIRAEFKRILFILHGNED